MIISQKQRRKNGIILIVKMHIGWYGNSKVVGLRFVLGVALDQIQSRTLKEKKELFNKPLAVNCSHALNYYSENMPIDTV